MKVLYYVDNNEWFGGFCCPLCYDYISNTNLSYENNVEENAVICCNNCGEMLVCLSFQNEINKGLDSGDKDDHCEQHISKVKMQAIFLELSLSLSLTDKDKSKNIKNAMQKFLENGYKFYTTSILKITNIINYNDIENVEDEEDLESQVVKSYKIPELISFDQIYNFDYKIDFEDFNYIGYSGECTECHRKYDSIIQL